MEILFAAGGLVLGGVIRHRIGVCDQPEAEHYPNSTVEREMARSRLHGNDFTNFSG